MAKNKCTVLLGYSEYEPIADRDKPYLNHAVNKIGGTPVSLLEWESRGFTQNAP